MGEPRPLTAYQQSYHWRNKNCGPWAHEWFKKALPGAAVEEGSMRGEVTEVTHISGDCDLGQRKGKLLTIYDLEVEMSWKGSIDGEDVEGKLTVPEVSHEAIDGLSDYTLNFSLNTPSSSGDSLVGYLRTALPPVLKEKFNSFRPALLDAHGQPSEASPADSGTSTPTPVGSSSYSPGPPTNPQSEKKAAPVPEKKEGKKVSSTATVEVKADLQASENDLWGLLTDEGKVPMWSRSAAKIILTPGSPFELFGGNVRGKIISADAPKKLVQSWQPKMPSWPSDHFGTMTIALNQGSDSTAVTFTLEGVPSGQEGDTERALEIYYIRGLKQLGLVISSSSRSWRVAPPRKKRAKPKAASQSWPAAQVLGVGALLALGAVFVGLVLSSFRDVGIKDR